MAHLLAGGLAEPRSSTASPPIVIGLVNSMPGEAFRQTEQQFRTVLAAAAGGRAVELRFFTLDAVPQAEPGAAAASRYEDTARLQAAAPDGLIVTGMPPRAAVLSDEPYWRKLTELVDFAVDHAVPTVWSCLAAHAAVLYLDGIQRRRLPQKLSGLVECTRTNDEHPIMAGLPWQWRMPHSRYNGVPEDALLVHGYRVLSHAPEAGADIFFKDDGAPFLFCQGHPEYDAQTLLREYRRDIRQFLAGERDGYPAAPVHYFSPDVATRLARFREQVLHARTGGRLDDFPMAACVADLRHSWRNLAVGLYDNWLTLVAERKVLLSGEAGLVRAPARLAEAQAVPALGAGAG